MKYALISDVHGNCPALSAVLKDAEEQGVERFLFLGDYVEDLPFPNEVTNVIRTLPHAWVIGGNKEGYLKAMREEDPELWVHEQFAPLYWNYRELTPENRDYLIGLPETMEIPCGNGFAIHLTHSSPIFFRAKRIPPFHSSWYAQQASDLLSHEEYLSICEEAVRDRPDVLEEAALLPTGVYVSGHNHLQGHMRLGDKLFVNPGSCGMPLDLDTRAPYTILEDADGWRVEERRVPYDVEGAIRALKSSELYAQAEVWSRIMVQDLETGADYIYRFFAHANAIAKKRNLPTAPYPNSLFREAADTFPWEVP